jgi:aspartate racemase
VRQARGPTASARCLLWSFDFSEIEALQHQGDWDGLTKLMVEAAQRLERAGADGIMICTNTMHKMADIVQASIDIPLLHIADPTAQAIKAIDVKRVGLLGTAFTMEQDFYKGRLTDRHGLDVVIPNEADRRIVHSTIYQELVAGIVTEDSRAAYRGVIARLIEDGAQAIILGCTEIMLLINASDSTVPLFDPTSLHAQSGVSFVLTA